MKKTIFSFLLSTGLLGLLFSCFCSNIQPFWNPKSFQIYVHDLNDQPPTLSQITTDTLILDLRLDVNYMSNNSLDLGLLNSCYATSCAPNGHSGMKDALADILITSDTTFNNIPKGQSLASIARINNQTIAAWIASESYNNLIFYDEQDIMIPISINEKPTNYTTHSFTVQLVSSSGQTLHATSDTLTWN